MTRQLSQSSVNSIVANSITASEVANIARANIGISWTVDGCTDFFWGVTALAGAPFFDLRGAANLENGDPLRPLDIPYSVPHSATQNAGGDKWSIISHGASATAIISTLQVGDVVRAYKAAHEDPSQDPFVGHEFIVSRIDASGTWAVDNTGSGGSITEHLISSTWSYLQLPDHVYISRLDPTFVLTDDFEGNPATTQSLALNSASVLGVIDRNGDADWFRVQLVQGTTYTIKVEGSATSQGTLADPYLRIYDNNGRYLDGNDDVSTSNFNSQKSFTAGYTGIFYLGARES